MFLDSRTARLVHIHKRMWICRWFQSSSYWSLWSVHWMLLAVLLRVRKIQNLSCNLQPNIICFPGAVCITLFCLTCTVSPAIHSLRHKILRHFLSHPQASRCHQDRTWKKLSEHFWNAYRPAFAIQHLMKKWIIGPYIACYQVRC